MELVGKTISLKLVKSGDEQLEALKEKLPEWQNLSEKNWYPGPMPERMTFKIEEKGKKVGAVELVNIRWFNRKAEISIWLLPEGRGKGIAKEALQSVMELAFEQFNFHRLEAEVYDFNQTARNLFKGLGFEQEGRLREAKYKDGNYYDIIRFGLLKDQWRKNR